MVKFLSVCQDLPQILPFIKRFPCIGGTCFNMSIYSSIIVFIILCLFIFSVFPIKNENLLKTKPVTLVHLSTLSLSSVPEKKPILNKYLFNACSGRNSTDLCFWKIWGNLYA